MRVASIPFCTIPALMRIEFFPDNNTGKRVGMGYTPCKLSLKYTQASVTFDDDEPCELSEGVVNSILVILR